METGGVPPAVDVATVDELERSVGSDREFLRELVETYLDDAPAQVAAIRQGQASGDIQLARRGAHTLKSNSASMGAHALSEMCRELESIAAEALERGAALDPGDVRDRVATIEHELDRVATELNARVPAGIT